MRIFENTNYQFIPNRKYAYLVSGVLIFLSLASLAIRGLEFGIDFSAIFDANITTFFVGAILYSFGVGPIQGFAVTLMAGILSSFFTAIVVTRVVFEYLIIDRRASVSYG